MKLQDLINSRLGLGFALTLSQMIPPRMGYALACWIADRISSRKHSQIVQAVRANQWVVHQGQLSSRELDQVVRATFRTTGRHLYDFYHTFRNHQEVREKVEFDPSFERWFHPARQEKQPFLFVVPHISNFDLIGRATVLRGLPLHILSYPQPPGGYRWQNRLRQLPNLLVTPMSIQALRQASETLRANRTVVTGVDRPLPDPDAKYQPRFFGRPAALPVFHIRLALKHDMPIIVLNGCTQPDGRYRLEASDPIPMQRHPDLVEETVRNAESVLAVIAEFIRQTPEQWAMFYTVWPEALQEMPA